MISYLALREWFEHETEDTVDETETTEDDETDLPIIRVQQPGIVRTITQQQPRLVLQQLSN